MEPNLNYLADHFERDAETHAALAAQCPDAKRARDAAALRTLVADLRQPGIDPKAALLAIERCCRAMEG